MQLRRVLLPPLGILNQLKFVGGCEQGGMSAYNAAAPMVLNITGVIQPCLLTRLPARGSANTKARTLAGAGLSSTLGVRRGEGGDNNKRKHLGDGSE